MLTELSPNESLTAVMSGAAATTNPHSWTMWSEGKPNHTYLALSGATAVTLVPAPSGSTAKLIDSVRFYNGDTAAVTITLSKVIDGTSRTIEKVTIGIGGSATISGDGVRAVDASGQVLQSAPSAQVDIDAGTSGTAGTVDVFPTTAAKGKLNVSATDSTGDTTTTITNAAQAAARTYTVPDAGESAQFVMSPPGVAAVTATADGLTTGLIPATAVHVTITSDTATKQVSLPAASVGKSMTLFVGATGCELISAVAADEVNDVVVGATNELALAADTSYHCQYVATDKWIVRGFTKLGADIVALVPDAL